MICVHYNCMQISQDVLHNYWNILVELLLNYNHFELVIKMMCVGFF